MNNPRIGVSFQSVIAANPIFGFRQPGDKIEDSRVDPQITQKDTDLQNR
jgi:hypothetical protein